MLDLVEGTRKIRIKTDGPGWNLSRSAMTRGAVFLVATFYTYPHFPQRSQQVALQADEERLRTPVCTLLIPCLPHLLDHLAGHGDRLIAMAVVPEVRRRRMSRSDIGIRSHRNR
jgi:hypothetical protein